MSNPLLIIGKPGSGKSSSLINLDPSTTFVISVIGKSLPFRGFRKNYKTITSWDDAEGNWYFTDNCLKILNCIRYVNEKRPDIHTLIIDDWQYMLSHEFLRKTAEHLKGSAVFDTYTDLAKNAWMSVMILKECRDSLFTVIMGHSEVNDQGFYRIKTLGKLLDGKMDFEGQFEMCLHARVVDGQYVFQTQQNDEYMARTPRNMFPELFIPNDLFLVKNAVESYFNEEE